MCLRYHNVVYYNYNRSIQVHCTSYDRVAVRSITPLRRHRLRCRGCYQLQQIQLRCGCGVGSVVIGHARRQQYYTQVIVIRRRERVGSRSAVVRQFASPSVLAYIVVLIIKLYKCYNFTLFVFLPSADRISWFLFITTIIGRYLPTIIQGQ